MQQDYTKAFYYYTKSAERGNVLAMSALANLYFNGFGTKRDPAMAIKLYNQAASKGSDVAL